MPDAWYNSSWSNRRKITFDNSAQAENLTNFPVLVKLNSSRIDYAKTQNAGQDIRFTDSDGTTLLSYEIEKWNESGDSFVWVKVPQVNASGSTDYIYVYYGNTGASDAQAATSVWRSEYKGVWHLKETGNGTAGEYKDSTTNANHGQGGGGTGFQAPTATTSGAVGTGQVFVTDDYIAITNAASLYISGSFSVGAWVYRTGTPGTYGGYIFADYNTGGTRCSYYLKIGSNNKAKFAWETSAGDPGPESTNALALNTWVWIVATWDGTTRRLYIDGAADTTNNTAQSRADDGSNTGIGRPGSYNGLYVPAWIDEVFIYSGALSAAWIAATYKSQADAFNTFGTEEAESGGADALTAAAITAGAPALDTPSLAQVNALVAVAITTGTPTAATATIGQTHALSAAAITAGTPTLDAPTIAQVHALTSVGITTGTPAFDAAALAQAHALATVGITTGTPVVDTATIAQVHVLTATDIVAGTPALDAPSMAGAAALTAADITTGAATLDAPTVGQAHALTAVTIVTGTPALGAAVIAQVHALTAVAITTGAAAVGAPSMAGESALSASGIATGAPALGTTTIAQVHVLAAVAITTGAVALDTPAIAQTHALSAAGIVTGAAVLGTPSLTGEAALTAGDIVAGAPALGTATLAQIHALAAATIAAGAPDMGVPVIGQVHVLTAVLIVAGAGVLGAPSLDRAVIPTPDARTFVVAWEDRTYVVGAEDRTYIVE